MQFGNTALIWSARRGYAAIAQELITRGANTDLVGMVGVCNHEIM